MKTLLGLSTFVPVLGVMIYLLVDVIKSKKAVYLQVANIEIVERAKTGENQYVFKTNRYRDLVLPLLWILSFSVLFLSNADLYAALFGILLLNWYMVIKIYYVIKSRKDRVILNGNSIEFYFEKNVVNLNVLEYQEANLEFRKFSSFNGSRVLPFLIFSHRTDKAAILANAALRQNPFEITEALGRLNPHLKLRKTWNDTLSKKIESSELQTTA